MTTKHETRDELTTLGALKHTLNMSDAPPDAVLSVQTEGVGPWDRDGYFNHKHTLIIRWED